MKSLIKLIRIKTMNSIVKMAKQLSVVKYGYKSDICVLTAGPDKSIAFQTSNTSGLVPIEHVGYIRRVVGENVLNICGLPQDNEPAPNIMLLISPSAFFTMGWKTFKLIKDWSGNSMVGELLAVTYTIR